MCAISTNIGKKFKIKCTIVTNFAKKMLSPLDLF